MARGGIMTNPRSLLIAIAATALGYALILTTILAGNQSASAQHAIAAAGGAEQSTAIVRTL
jgi:hypothetical protein